MTALPRDDPNEGKQPKLPHEDNPPFSPPDGTVSDPTSPLSQRTDDQDSDITHQATDSNVDEHQAYDEGVMNAAEAQEPNLGNAVTDFNPDEASDEKQ